MSGAIVAAMFDIVVLGKRRDHGCAAGDLADATENDFRTAVVEFDGSMDFDGPAGQAADVADIFQSGREDYYSEGARHLICAEVEEVNSFISNSYFEDFTLYTLSFTDVVAGFVNGDAVGGLEQRRRQHNQ
jgi:hypothetical protein